MGLGYLVVEGHGEVEAANNLVTRLWNDLSLPFLPWRRPIRRTGLNRPENLTRACDIVRRKREPDALLVIRDEDDSCPKDTAPKQSKILSEQDLPFPAAIVLMHREYEVLFLPCVRDMSGLPILDESGVKRPGLLPGTTFDGNPEDIRGVKEWLSDHFPPDLTYKPSIDQLPLTRMIKFELIRDAGNVPCFSTLERALRFLSANIGHGGVFPPPELGR